MVIEEVGIRNFKGIEESTLELKPGFNLVKGENGKGKTSIVEAIAVGLGGFVAGFSDVATRHFSKDEIRKIVRLSGDGSCAEYYQVPTEVTIKAEIDGEKYSWTRGRSSVNASRSTIQPRKIYRLAEKLSLDENAEYPVLLYEGAGRVWSQKRERSGNVFQAKRFRAAGYADALLEATNIKLLKDWCIKMEQVSWKKNMPIAEYEAVKRAAADFMGYLNGTGSYRIFYDKQLEELVYSSDGQLLPVSDLSAGYQSLVWMIFDIACRMAVLNPDKKENICQTKGVVLIDEIDMHLHPKWQWNIIDALRKTFPNVQFIATTHAPILFASAQDVWVVDIENREYRYASTHYGLDINSALEEYQETTGIALEVQKKVDRFYDALDEGQYEKAQGMLRELEIATAPDHPTLIQMRTRYEFETMELGD